MKQFGDAEQRRASIDPMIDEFEKSLRKAREDQSRAAKPKPKHFEQLKPLPKLGKIGQGVGQSMMSRYRQKPLFFQKMVVDPAVDKTL